MTSTDHVRTLLADGPLADIDVQSRDAAGGPLLVIYAVPKTDADLGKLRRWIARRTVTMEAPTVTAFVDVIPRDHAGSVDSAALREVPVVEEASLTAQRQVISRSGAQPQPVRLARATPPRSPAPLAAAPRGRSPAPSDRRRGVDATADEGSAQIEGDTLREPSDRPVDLPAALEAAARLEPDHGVHTYDETGTHDFVGYSGLYEAARRMAGGLSGSVADGSPILLQFTDIGDYFPALWGALLARLRPVTVAAPPGYTARSAPLDKLRAAWETLGRPPVLSSGTALEGLAGVGAVYDGDAPHLIDARDAASFPPPDALPSQASADPTALLQLSAGSTGASKPIQISHRGIISYAYGSAQVTGIEASHTTVNWLPLDHVGSLIMFHLRDVVLRATNVHASTNWVIADPTRWLDLLEDHGADHTWAPNFGYRLLAEALEPGTPRGWDISHVRTFLNGGEQCTLPVIESFLKAVDGFGVTADQLLLAWGMAETCTAITYKRFSHKPVVRRARDDGTGAESTAKLLSVGHPAPNSEMRIVDEHAHVLDEGMIGSLQVRSERITPGYLGATGTPVSPEGWFDTGDLAFIEDHEVVIAGRAKEVIVVNGANVLCHEIEEAVGTIEGVTAGSVAACSVPDPATGSESIGIFFVASGAREASALAAVEQEVRLRVTQQVGSPPTLIQPLAEQDFPRTTSGKIQRAALRARALGEAAPDSGPVETDTGSSQEAAALPLLEEVWVPAARGTAVQDTDAMVVIRGSGPADGELAEAMASAFSGCEIVELPSAPESHAFARRVVRSGCQTVLYLPGYLSRQGSSPDMALANRVSADYVGAAVALAQAGFEGRLITVTRALHGASGGTFGSVEASSLPILAAAAGEEFPAMSFQHVDLPGRDPAQEAAAMGEIASGPAGEFELWDDGETLRARRFARVSRSANERPRLRTGGLYIATGGLGGVGSAILEALLRTSDIRVLALGRSNAGPSNHGEPSRRLARLAAIGDISYHAVDVTDAAALGAAVARAEADGGAEIAGAFHFAGDYGFAPLAEFDEEAWSRQSAAKVEGLVNLVDLLEQRSDTGLWVASSLLSSIPTLGSGAYAASNGFVEACCARLNRAGSVSATCVSWGLWKDLGLNADNPLSRHVSRRGIHELDAQEGQALALQSLSAAPGVYLAGLREDAPEVKRRLLGVRPSPVEELVFDEGSEVEADVEAATDRWGASLPIRRRPAPAAAPVETGAANSSDHAELQEVIARQMRPFLGRELGPDEHFQEAGLGSIKLVQAQAKIEEALGWTMDRTALFEFPTAAALAHHLAETRSRAEARPGSAPVSSPDDEGHMAIIGMTLHLPGAQNADRYWANLRSGVDSTTRFEADELLASGFSRDYIERPDFVPVSGSIEDAYSFDGARFKMPPREVSLTSPQQRLLLAAVDDLLQASGYDRSDEREQLGIFAGTGMNLYALQDYLLNTVLDDNGSLDPITAMQVAIGNEPDFAATRIAYKLGLRGPAVNIQTACSTSLVALHQACQAIRCGDCDAAVVGAAAVHDPQVNGYIAREGSILSPSGECRAFDREADGTVGGNGVVALLIKPLAAARADGDRVHATIRGSAINNDGSEKASFTAPGMRGQVEVVQKALGNARLNAEDVSYVQAHGTGTIIGDPIEVQALSRAFGLMSERTCHLGSVKPNIGHLDSAAGLAGLVATVLALEHREVPPQLHYSDPNPDMHLAETPFRIPREPLAVEPPGDVMRASVSALGVGGTNAHVILEEAR